MADDLRLYRERAEAEREIAANSILPNVRDRSLRAAQRWEDLAKRAERAQAQAGNRSAP